jgi:hypothetical protein
MPSLTELSESHDYEEGAPVRSRENFPMHRHCCDRKDDEGDSSLRPLQELSDDEEDAPLRSRCTSTQWSEAFAVGSLLKETEVGLNTICSRSLFADPQLLRGVHEGNERISMGGILWDGRRIVTAQVGESPSGRVYMSEQASVNVLSMGKMTDRVHSVRMVDNAFELQMTDGPVYTFKPRGQNRL